MLVNAKGQYVINKAPVDFASIEQLAGELRSAGAGLREPIVIISADAAATHQSVIRVMEASRLAGLSQITFTTQSSQQSRARRATGTGRGAIAWLLWPVSLAFAVRRRGCAAFSTACASSRPAHAPASR